MTGNGVNGMNTGTRTMGLLLMGNELVAIIYDARWLMLVITACVVADFRYGWGESHKRYAKAKDKGDKIVMSQYRWRTSRAVRRTVNKLVDYLIWVCLGMFTGYAILKPLGADYTLGGIVATTIAVGCEAKSFIGHFFYLHGVRIEEKSVKGFLRALSWRSPRGRTRTSARPWKMLWKVTAPKPPPNLPEGRGKGSRQVDKSTSEQPHNRTPKKHTTVK